MAALFTVNVTELDTAKQGPKGSSVVKVRVTVPPLEAMGVNVTVDGVMVVEVLLS